MYDLDGLTGLQTRAAFEDIRKTLKTSDLAIVYFDINNLKNTNDSLGHRFGDKLITTVADAIKKQFRFEEIFRTGGDEFIVLMNGVGPAIIDKRLKAIKDICEDATRNDLDDLVYQVASGYCISDGTMDYQTIENEAESRMYANKKLLKEKNPSTARGFVKEAVTGFTPAVKKGMSQEEVDKITVNDDTIRRLVNPGIGQYIAKIASILLFLGILVGFLIYI